VTVRFARHPDLRLTALDGEGVVLHLGTRRYFTLSESGVDILEGLATPRDIEGIVDLLTAKYDVTTELARETASGFLDICRHHGLITAEELP